MLAPIGGLLLQECDGWEDDRWRGGSGGPWPWEGRAEGWAEHSVARPGRVHRYINQVAGPGPSDSIRCLLRISVPTNSFLLLVPGCSHAAIFSFQAPPPLS